MDLSVELAPNHPPKAGGLRLANPIMTASGTFGYGTEYASLIDIQRLGAIVCKAPPCAPFQLTEFGNGWHGVFDMMPPQC